MPGKVNPVIAEAVSQAAMSVMGYDSVLTNAYAQGSLELNAFLPLIAECLLASCDLLTRACDLLATRCVVGIEADEARCRAHVEASTAVAKEGSQTGPFFHSFDETVALRDKEHFSIFG